MNKEIKKKKRNEVDLLDEASLGKVIGARTKTAEAAIGVEFIIGRSPTRKVGYTRLCLFSEVNQHLARIVLGRVTSWELLMLLVRGTGLLSMIVFHSHTPMAH